MLIRSQDKRHLINLKNVCHLQLSESTEPKPFTIECNCVDAGSLVIGAYQSEDRAIKVLDLIQVEYESRLSTVNNVFEMPMY